jgi:hypothetical protein
MIMFMTPRARCLALALVLFGLGLAGCVRETNTANDVAPPSEPVNQVQMEPQAEVVVAEPEPAPPPPKPQTPEPVVSVPEEDAEKLEKPAWRADIPPPVEGGETSYPPNDQANFSCPAGGFEVCMPGPPTLSQPRARKGISGEFYRSDSSGARFFAGFFEHPYPGLKSMVLKRTVRRAAEKVDGKFLSQEEIAYAGHKGMEFSIASPLGTRVVGRHYAMGTLLYMVRYTAPEGAFDARQAKAFLDSFRIAAYPDVANPAAEAE